MDDGKHKLIIDGNAFYELDLECLRKKEQQREKAERGRNSIKEQEVKKRSVGNQGMRKRGRRS